MCALTVALECVLFSQRRLLLQEVKGERRSGRTEFDVAAEEKKYKSSNLLNNDRKV